MDKSRGDRTDAESQCYRWKPPSRPDPFAHEITGDLKNNIRDKEDREHGVVIIAYETKILVKAGQFSVTYSQKGGLVLELEIKNWERIIGTRHIPTLARSMKQKRYIIATVGTI